MYCIRKVKTFCGSFQRSVISEIFIFYVNCFCLLLSAPFLCFVPIKAILQRKGIPRIDHVFVCGFPPQSSEIKFPPNCKMAEKAMWWSVFLTIYMALNIKCWCNKKSLLRGYFLRFCGPTLIVFLIYFFNSSTAFGFQTSIGRIASVLGNVVFGVFIDLHCAVPLVCVAICFIVGGIFVFIVPKTDHTHLL